MIETFIAKFELWASHLDADEDETLSFVYRLRRLVDDLPEDERLALEIALEEFGPIWAARCVEVCESAYGIERSICERATELLPLARDAIRVGELVSMPYREYLATPEWAERAAETRARFGHRCAVCNAEDDLDAHHRTYERRGHELAGDLTALCRACHSLFHEWRDLATTAQAGDIARDD